MALPRDTAVRPKKGKSLWRPPVRGENAAEKARTPVVQAARETVDKVIAGQPTKTASKLLRALELSEPEKRDVERYSRVRSEKSLRENDFQEQAASVLLGPNLAKLLPGGTPAREASLKGVALDAALLAPGTLIGKPIVGAARGARAAGKAVKPARPMPEGATVPARSLQVGEKVQQLPAARSRVTKHLIEKPADKVSAAMMGEGKVAGAARKVLPTAAASARVAKASGREQVLEAARAQAGMAQHIRRLPKEGSAEDIAHSWWAQLPVSHRNAEGLRLVRGKQAEELEEITSGRALEGLKRQEGALKAQLADADEATRFDLIGQLEDVKLLLSDLPERVSDLSVSLARLDRVIARPPKLDPKVIDAVDTLSGDRRSVLEAAEVLKPERASEREGLVSRWVGLEPTGEEAFLGHRLGKVRGSQPSLMPVSVGAGRVKLPQGVARENKLVLAKTGRLRESTRVAAEDWQAAQVYRSATSSRKDLGQMGSKPAALSEIRGKLASGDFYLVNPKGRAVPPHWKTDKLAQIDPDDTDAIEEAAREIVAVYRATNADEADAMLKAVGVNWPELRLVPKKTADRYFGQFTPAAGSGRGAKVYDAAVDFTAASIVFARLGYIPKNIAQNLIIAVPHQGPKLLVNVPRTAQALADRELRPLLQAEVGFSGATQGLAGEARFGKAVRGLPSKTAAAVGKVGDDPMRMSAFIHEAAAAGVISKWKPVLDEADRAQLIRLLTDPQFRPLLNDVRARSVEAMADFSRLTPTQRRWARRYLIIPGWLWAGSRYPIHFAATHPARSAAIGYVAAGEPGAPEELQVNKPFHEFFADDLPHYIDGIPLGDKLLRTTSLSPVSTPLEIANAVAQRDGQTVGDYAQPLGAALWNLAHSTVEGPNGPYKTDVWTSVKRNAERLVPNVDLVRDLISPPDDTGRYPEDATRLGRLRRELGVFPIEVEREGGSTSSSGSGSLWGSRGGGRKGRSLWTGRSG